MANGSNDPELIMPVQPDQPQFLARHPVCLELEWQYQCLATNKCKESQQYRGKLS